MSNSENRTTREGLDTTFADEGVACVFPPNSEALRIVECGTDGKTLLAGTVSTRFQLAQLLENGDLDPDFGIAGIRSGAFKEGVRASAIGAHVLEDGKILLIGFHFGEVLQIAFAKFERDGTPDPSFGENGVVISTQSSSDDALELEDKPAISAGNAPTSKTAIGPNGEIAVAYDFTIRLYTSNGQQYRTIVTNPRFFPQALGVAGNTITAVGTSAGYGAISRFDFEGKPVSDFGVNGHVRLNIDDGYTVAVGLLLRKDNSFFISGFKTPDLDSSPQYRGILAAFNSNGQPNLVFNGGKPVITETPSGQACRWNTISADSDHGLVVAGSIGLVSHESTLIARYKTTGEIDASFGQSGFLETQIGTESEKAYSLQVQPDRKPVVSIEGTARATVVRYRGAPQ